MRIAVIGAGIAGNTVAWKLHRDHEITVFEAARWIGGHYAYGRCVSWRQVLRCRYRLHRLQRLDLSATSCSCCDEIDVATQPSTMSFSVRCERTGLEYNGTSLNTLFAQRRNLVRPAFHGMLRDILRFNREAPRCSMQDPAISDMTLGDYLATRVAMVAQFIEHYLLPMGAAIWSTEPARMLDCPASFFIRFFANHGMLSVDDRPQWRVVRGGSRTYVEKLTAPFRDRIAPARPVRRVRVTPAASRSSCSDGTPQRFDAVFRRVP